MSGVACCQCCQCLLSDVGRWLGRLCLWDLVVRREKSTGHILSMASAPVPVPVPACSVVCPLSIHYRLKIAPIAN